MENDADNCVEASTESTEAEIINRIKEAIAEGDRILSPAWIVLQISLAFASFVLLLYSKASTFEGFYYDVRKIYGNYNLQAYQVQNFQNGNYITLIHSTLTVLIIVVNL